MTSSWQPPDWRRASWLWRPATLCQFSGCTKLRARTVEWKALRFDLCDGHAAALEASR